MNDKIQKAIDQSLEMLVRADNDLIALDVNERSISHRIALYLESWFPGWNVDCEYNRGHHDTKRLDIQPRDIKSNDTQACTIYPDIIVHKRNTNHNLVVIEIKKTSNRENDEHDKRKLKAFKSQLGYQFAVFINIKVGQSPSAIMEWV